MNRAGFDNYLRDSELMASLDKNHDGMLSATELTGKAELAFRVGGSSYHRGASLVALTELCAVCEGDIWRYDKLVL